MTINTTSSQTVVPNLQPPAPWICGLLGVVLIGAGIVVLGDVMVATIISAIVIGATAIVAGLFEVVHAFWTKGWGGFLWNVVLGILYVAFGLVLVTQPISGALVLTYVFGLLLLVSGIFRVFVGFSRTSGTDWLMLLSGCFGILAGLVILTGWPSTGLWVFGFVLGVDLNVHGVAWLAYAWRPMSRTA